MIADLWGQYHGVAVVARGEGGIHQQRSLESGNTVELCKSLQCPRVCFARDGHRTSSSLLNEPIKEGIIPPTWNAGASARGDSSLTPTPPLSGIDVARSWKLSQAARLTPAARRLQLSPRAVTWRQASSPCAQHLPSFSRASSG